MAREQRKSIQIDTRAAQMREKPECIEFDTKCHNGMQLASAVAVITNSKIHSQRE